MASTLPHMTPAKRAWLHHAAFIAEAEAVDRTEWLSSRLVTANEHFVSKCEWWPAAGWETLQAALLNAGLMAENVLAWRDQPNEPTTMVKIFENEADIGEASRRFLDAGAERIAAQNGRLLPASGLENVRTEPDLIVSVGVLAGRDGELFPVPDRDDPLAAICGRLVSPAKKFRRQRKGGGVAAVTAGLSGDGMLLVHCSLTSRLRLHGLHSAS